MARGKTRTFATAGEIGKLREEALELCRKGRFYCTDWRDPERQVEQARSMGQLAFALDDLEMAREIDLAEIRARITTRILSRRGELRQVRTLAELSRGIQDTVLREATLSGIVGGMAHPSVARELIPSVRRMEDDEARDDAWGKLAMLLGEPVLASRIRSRPIRIDVLSHSACKLGRPGLARQALDQARQEEDPCHLIYPMTATGRLNDRPLRRRAIRIASTVNDIEVKIRLFDELGGLSLDSTLSRQALRMTMSLLESEPDEWDDCELEGTRDVPLAHLAIRHGSLTLARRVRCAGIRDLAVSGVAEARGDAKIAEEIADEYNRARALINIGQDRKDPGLIDEAIGVCREGNGMPSASYLLFDALVVKIAVLRVLMPEQLSLPLAA